MQLLFTHLAEALQVRHLLFERVVRAVEPEPPLGPAVNPKRPANGVSKLTSLQLVVLGKDFDAFHQTGPLDGNLQPQGEVVDIDPAFPRELWLLEEDPEVAAAFAHLQRGLNFILLKVVLKLKQILHGVLVVGVDRYPLTTL